MTHEEICTHIKNIEDQDILTRQNFDVNMRLFNTSPGYRKLVRDACDYISSCAVEEHEGYSTPKGWSGANAGIPWRIIAVVVNGAPWVLMNPMVTRGPNTEIVLVKSNCGSLTLPSPIMVARYKEVIVDYYSYSGDLQRVTLGRKGGGFTVQHETDHTNGILITDKGV